MQNKLLPLGDIMQARKKVDLVDQLSINYDGPEALAIAVVTATRAERRRMARAYQAKLFRAIQEACMLYLEQLRIKRINEENDTKGAELSQELGLTTDGEPEKLELPVADSSDGDQFVEDCEKGEDDGSDGIETKN